MPDRDPYVVLGLSRGASRAAVKAAWRKLARQHHPDTTGDDPSVKRLATRRMAEINRAYEALSASSLPDPAVAARRPNGPPPAPPQRPVTGRLDTTATFRPRNATTTPPGRHVHPPGQAPPARVVGREPPRASDPTGPLRRRRSRRFRPRPEPTLAEAAAIELAFGRFHGHTLGEVAGFEPSYIDWLARTVTRDPDLVAAARVVKTDLDERGVVRRPRPIIRPNGHPFERSF
jgi:hypothetical protein